MVNNNSFSLSPNNKDISALYKSTPKSDLCMDDDKKPSDPQLVKVHLSHTSSLEKVSYVDIRAQNKKPPINGPERATEDRKKRRGGITQNLVDTWDEIRTASDKKSCRERLNSIYHSLPVDEKGCQNLSEGEDSRGDFQEDSQPEVSVNGKSPAMSPSSFTTLEKAPLSSKNKEVDEKFVINLYESRLRRNQSFRKSRLKIYQKGSGAQSPASTLFKNSHAVKSPASKLDCSEAQDETQRYVTATAFSASEESKGGPTEEESSVFFKETHLLCSTRDFGKGDGHCSAVQSNVSTTIFEPTIYLNLLFPISKNTFVMFTNAVSVSFEVGHNGSYQVYQVINFEFCDFNTN